MGDEIPGVGKSREHLSLLASAGFELLDESVLEITIAAAHDPAARRFAHMHVQKSIQLLDGHADSADLDAIATLLDHGPAADARWASVELGASCSLLIARPVPSEVA